MRACGVFVAGVDGFNHVFYVLRRLKADCLAACGNFMPVCRYVGDETAVFRRGIFPYAVKPESPVYFRFRCVIGNIKLGISENIFLAAVSAFACISAMPLSFFSESRSQRISL